AAAGSGQRKHHRAVAPAVAHVCVDAAIAGELRAPGRPRWLGQSSAKPHLPRMAEDVNNRMPRYGAVMAPSAPPPLSTRDLVRRAVDLIAERLPAEWSAELRNDATVGRMTVDGLLRIVAPDSQATSVVLEAKRRLDARDVSQAAERLQALRAEFADDESSA